MKKNYPRNLVGYGNKEMNVVWPNNSRLALQIVLNYEEGAENSILHGDNKSSLDTAKSIRENLAENGLELKALNKMKKFL